MIFLPNSDDTSSLDQILYELSIVEETKENETERKYDRQKRLDVYFKGDI